MDVINLIADVLASEYGAALGIWFGATATAIGLLATGRKFITAPMVAEIAALRADQQEHAERQEKFEERSDARFEKVSETQDLIGKQVSKIEGHLGL